MYTIVNDQGIVYRNSDKVIVSPVADENDPKFKDYIAWVNAGNWPTIVDTDPNFVPGVET